MNRWTMTQGRSVANVQATDHADAIAHGAAIGFTAPTSVVLDNDREIYRQRVAANFPRKG